MKESIKFDCSEVVETTLTVKVNPSNLSGMKVIGIDGGLSQHEYHGMDMILTRAVAAIFNYSDGKLEVDYYPSPIVSPNLLSTIKPIKHIIGSEGFNDNFYGSKFKAFTSIFSNFLV